MNIIREKIKIYDMTCTSCENKVKKVIKRLDGVVNVTVNYRDEFTVVEYDDEICDLNTIKSTIKKAGYSTESSNDYKFIGILIIVTSIILLGFRTSGFDMESKLANASYSVIFIVGVLTSIHCVGMCGGIMFSQSIQFDSKNKLESIKPALHYNIGRVISYTILGGLIGSIGSVFSLSITTKSIMQIIAGSFMIMMGFNMAGFSIFKWFKIKLPHVSFKLKNKSGSNFIVGLINGFMPCGPLQTMQLFALGTGSAIKGALAMFVFSLGTVPLMLTFGVLSGLLSKGYTKKILKLSGVLIIVLGLIIGNRGFTLAGININPLSYFPKNIDNLTSYNSINSNGNSINSSESNLSKATLQDGVQVINMTADNNGYTPNTFYVQKGIPVKWIIDGKQLNSCNNDIVARSLDTLIQLESGENIIEFNPGDTDINFSCWMGMIKGVIKVVDKLDSFDTSKDVSSTPQASTVQSCCADHASDDSTSEYSNKPSIYGNDIRNIKTETLINRTLVVENYQLAKFKGIGYEFQPLIFVTESSSSTKLTFDLNDFDNADGEYLIVDVDSGDIVSTFTGKKDINEVTFTNNKIGGYAIIKENIVLGIIDVVDNLETIDLEEIRSKYIQ